MTEFHDADVHNDGYSCPWVKNVVQRDFKEFSMSLAAFV